MQLHFFLYYSVNGSTPLIDDIGKKLKPASSTLSFLSFKFICSSVQRVHSDTFYSATKRTKLGREEVNSRERDE